VGPKRTPPGCSGWPPRGGVSPTPPQRNLLQKGSLKKYKILKLGVLGPFLGNFAVPSSRGNPWGFPREIFRGRWELLFWPSGSIFLVPREKFQRFSRGLERGFPGEILPGTPGGVRLRPTWGGGIRDSPGEI